MAAKRTSDLIPLCHPIAITHVSVELEVADTQREIPNATVSETAPEVTSSRSSQASLSWAGTGRGDGYKFLAREPSSTSPFLEAVEQFGQVDITATVSCDGKTGVEMEALTAASVAAMTVYDMCKAVDKGMRIEGLRVTRKEGGKSGTWEEGEKTDTHD